jgi:hypothetical protein
MELLSTDRTQPYDNEGKRNQIVNEQDQQEKVNPSDEDSSNMFEENQKNEEVNYTGKTNQSEMKEVSKDKDVRRNDEALPKN